ncbi:MAG: class I SAM-dependent methyltransferase [Bacteroidia bacterium]|nr:class I SAM-dependent methyltransferase [Bacteroidia bacterium]
MANHSHSAAESAQDRSCRFCNSTNLSSMVNLGMSPLCESYIYPEKMNSMEPFYPLHTFVCGDCWLVQLDEYVSGEEIFGGEYAYFSSYSTSWVQHAKDYTDLMVERFGFKQDNLMVEIASNDGYLLQWFVEKGIPVLGVEPSENCSAVAIEKGVRTEVVYFGVESAKKLKDQYGSADLLLGNNVLAHVPDINDFVEGMKVMLGEKGVITMEFPHLQRLVEENQFDTIYHEHFCYLSFLSVTQIFAKAGLTLFDVEEIPTHGGSLRIYGRHTENTDLPVTERAQALLQREKDLGMDSFEFYADFEEKVKETKRKLLSFLIDAKRSGKTVVGYGAPGKGNTLLNYCGIREDFLDYVVDRSDYKQGKFLPGTHIPIHHPDKIAETKPDYVLILPWNIKDEIIRQMAFIGEWGAKFVVPIPETIVFDPPVLTP